jgi:hypothetical protein
MNSDVMTDEDGASPGFGPNAATILATEHWSLLGTRSMAWNEAMSRAGVFLTVLSAAVVALALVGNATDFAPPFATFALVLLPAVLFVGFATYTRLVQIHVEDRFLVQAMNRLRHAYLDMEPVLARYLSTSSYDDMNGVLATYTLGAPLLPTRILLITTTPTIVATLDAVIAAAVAGLVAVVLGGNAAAVAVAAALTFGAVLYGLSWMESRVLLTVGSELTLRFPTPPGDPAQEIRVSWWGLGGRPRR